MNVQAYICFELPANSTICVRYVSKSSGPYIFLSLYQSWKFAQEYRGYMHCLHCVVPSVYLAFKVGQLRSCYPVISNCCCPVTSYLSIRVIVHS